MKCSKSLAKAVMMTQRWEMIDVPYLSIIIPCYNAVNYIDRCMECLRNQTIGFENLQVILVNDGSTDFTLGKMLFYENMFPEQMVVINCEENRGQGAAKNTGLNYAQADFVAFLDVDDVIAESFYEKLYKKIIDELGELNYSGRLALHSNNEPFLDSRIIEFTKYAREKVPKAFLYMYTNGTLVTIDKFNEIIPYLDRMVIDNYDDDLKLHENAKKIHAVCKSNREIDRKVEIHIRKVHEVLDTRGGQSPNNKKRKTYHMSCILPYKQMIIRPDGKTSLCCNDPYGKNTLADVNKMTLREAWYSKRAQRIRRSLR